MAEHQIRWRRGDYVTLGKAISDFNRKINELNAEEQKLYLPDLLNYEEEKNLIKTRRQLNNLVKSLKRFKIEGAEEKLTLEAGDEITKWEFKELNRQAKTGIRRLEKELSSIDVSLHPFRYKGRPKY